MAARGVSLTREAETSVFIPNSNRKGFRMRIVAKNEVMMPATLFGHQRRISDPHTGRYSEDFCFVASPDDFAVLPVDEPRPADSPPFYLKSVIDAIYDSREQALAVWDAVEKDVCELIEALNRKDILVVEETVRCGADLDDETSESSISLSEEASESSVSASV